MGRADPMISRVDGKVLEPAARDFRIHDMKVTIRLNLLGWQLATFRSIWTWGSSVTMPRRGAP